jgi:hypothetical protein
VSGVVLPHEAPSWGGFSRFTVSNQTDVTTAGFGNPGSAFSGGGSGDANFGVGYASEALRLGFEQAGGVAPLGIELTNTTYAALSMRDGDGFAKRFGGADGTDADWFKVEIAGIDAADGETGVVEMYLADYRSGVAGDGVIVDSWEALDLSVLGSGVVALEFRLSSTDNGAFGMNTPAYFAFDNLTYAIPEPRLWGMLLGLAAFGWVLRRRRAA